MHNVVPHIAALQEHFEAIEWYEAIGQDLSDRYRNAVQHVLDTIRVNPKFYGWRDDVYREARVRGFPYCVIYREVRSGFVSVIAIAHTSRDPDYWRTRVSGDK